MLILKYVSNKYLEKVSSFILRVSLKSIRKVSFTESRLVMAQ